MRRMSELSVIFVVLNTWLDRQQLNLSDQGRVVWQIHLLKHDQVIHTLATRVALLNDLEMKSLCREGNISLINYKA